MTGQRITRVSRVDAAPAAFCLVSVSPDVSHASRPLDLKVVGTEGENAFVGTSKSSMPGTTSPAPAPAPAPTSSRSSKLLF
jgi:hypothetical protein